MALKKNGVDVTLSATRIFFENLYSDKEININVGGGGSSKSHSIRQLFAYKFLTEPRKKFLIVRKTMPAMRNSVILPFYETLNDFGVMDKVKIDRVNMNFFYGDSLLHFQGLDDPEKVKCFHPDTDIFTKEGFKNIKDINVGDLVATVNPKTNKAEFLPVENKYIYDFDGDMISPASVQGIRSSYAGFCVTPEHKMLTHTRRRKEWEFVKAGELPNTYFVKQSAEFNSGNFVDYFEIPKNNFNSETSHGRVNFISKKLNKNGRKATVFPIIPWLKFFGWYISEGSRSGGGYTVKISQTKKEGVEKLTELFKEFPYNAKYCHGSFSIYGKDLGSYLDRFGLSHEKYIPREILDLHPSLLKYLFETLMDGDGSIRPSGNGYSYCTNSPKLVENMFELGIKLGYAVSVREIDTKKAYGDRAKPAWCLYFDKREDVRLANKKLVPYKGKVYCINVPPYHTTLCRFNGKIAWTGQSSEYNYMWIEEATDIFENDFSTLRLYLRAPSRDGLKNQIFLSFNPIDEFHWIKTKLIDDPAYNDDIKIIHSTYKDNPFLDETTTKRYENLITQDIHLYRIYALGEWGRLENLIYKNWDIVKADTIPKENIQVVYGVDFGFNAESAVVKCTIKGMEVWEEELLYKKGWTNSQLIEFLKKVIDPKDKMRAFYCDSAEPDRIKEIRLSGFNAKLAQKSVQDGIDLVKRLTIHITDDSENLIKEKRAYSWKTNKNGDVIDEPVDFFNHLCDSERYALYSKFKSSNLYSVRWI